MTTTLNSSKLFGCLKHMHTLIQLLTYTQNLNTQTKIQKSPLDKQLKKVSVVQGKIMLKCLFQLNFDKILPGISTCHLPLSLHFSLPNIAFPFLLSYSFPFSPPSPCPVLTKQCALGFLNNDHQQSSISSILMIILKTMDFFI